VGEEMAPLRMPDEGDTAAGLGEHLRGDLAGERAPRLPVTVLRPEGDRRPGEDSANRRERGVRRADDDLRPARPAEPVAHGLRHLLALGPAAAPLLVFD